LTLYSQDLHLITQWPQDSILMMEFLLQDLVLIAPEALEAPNIDHHLIRIHTLFLIYLHSISMRPKTSNPGDKQRFPGPGSYDQTSRILNESIPNVK